jgi:DNA polymerase III subunit epsilon
MPVNFVAIDVETANPDMASICQIGIVKCEDASISEEWTTYVNPMDYFDPFNISIHGIDESKVREAPSFPETLDTLLSILEGFVIVSHTHFDRVALEQAARRFGLSIPNMTWLDSSRVARRTWQECSRKGYGLSKVCKIIGHEFKHHDALEDARAAAHILLEASRIHQLNIDGWLKRVQQPINPSSGSYSDIRLEGNPEGPFYGEVLAFTGSLKVPRREAAEKASEMGYKVASGVTKQTTVLVVGDQDIKKLAGHKKSSKHRKAEELITQGILIRIIQESDFLKLA